MAAKKKSLQARIKAGDRGAIKQALAKPGWRRYVTDPKQLAAAGKVGKGIAKRRALTKRLDVPIVQGSTTTERELARAAHAETALKYGPVEQQQRQTLGEAQTFQRDIGNFYDQYQQQVAQHAQNVQNIGAQAQQAVQGLQGGVTGLAQADLTQLQGNANQQAAQRGAQAGDLTQMANQATAVRQALVGSFAAQQAAQNAASSTYAGGLANVVAPGQKLQGVAQAVGKVRQAREQQAATAKEKAAYDVSFRGERRSEEAKNILAASIASGKTAADLAQTNIQARTQKDIAAGHDRTTLRQSEQAAKAAGNKTITSGAFQGYTNAQVQRHSEGWKNSMVDKYNRTTHPGRTGKAGNGTTTNGKDGKTPTITPGQAGPWYQQLVTAKGYAKNAKSGLKFFPKGGDKPGEPGHPDKGARLDRHRAAVKIAGLPGIKNPVIGSAAADAVYLGFISADTVRRLREAGLDPNQAAGHLGVPTWQVWDKYRRTHAGPFRTPRGP